MANTSAKILSSIGSEHDPNEVVHPKLFLQSSSNAVKMSEIGSSISADTVSGSRYAEGPVEMLVDAGSCPHQRGWARWSGRRSSNHWPAWG